MPHQPPPFPVPPRFRYTYLDIEIGADSATGPGGDDDLGPTLFPENYKTGEHDASFVWNCPLRSCMGLFSGKDRLDEHWEVIFHFLPVPKHHNATDTASGLPWRLCVPQ